LMEHIMSEHFLDTCDSCEALAISDFEKFLKHLPSHLGCPLCSEILADVSGLEQHIAQRHYGPSSFEDIGQMISEHSWIQCPFLKCYLVSATGLWRHVREAHRFTRCSACPTTVADFSTATEHITAHEEKQCPACVEMIAGPILEQHLVELHDWIQCEYCIVAAVDESDLQEHISEHKLTSCQRCKEKRPWKDINQHMVQAHGWLRCSFCDETHPQDDILEHMHAAHEKCPHCEFRGNLASHFEVTHDPAQCPICKRKLPRDDLKDHMDTQHPLRSRRLSEAPEHIRAELPAGGHAARGHNAKKYSRYSTTKQPRRLNLDKCENCREARQRVRQSRI